MGVLLPLAATWSLGSAVAFSLSWVLAEGAFDRSLLDDASVIGANVVERDGALILNLTPHEIDTLMFDLQDKEYFSVYDAHRRLVVGSADLVAAGAHSVGGDAFSEARLNGDVLRIAAIRNPGPRPFLVMVGQTTVSRNRLLIEVLERSLLPQLVLLLLLGVYLWRQISRELQPLGELQRALERRHSADLQPVAAKAGSSDVERLRDAVNELLARLGRGVQAQREFAGNVAHELRTPLAGIRALAEYGLAQDKPEVWRLQLHSIVQSEERAGRLVNQLLALALADEASESVKLEPIRVNELVRRTLLSFLTRADAAGIELEGEGLDMPTTALASPLLLEGVLANLIDNALRYGRSGAQPTLVVAIKQAVPGVLISVSDTGPGLNPKQLEQMMKRWAQGSAGTRLGVGAGLGLAIVSRYVALMGGTLSLDVGPEGRGLQATVSLQAAPES